MILLIFIMLPSCLSNSNDKVQKNYSFNEKMSFNEYKIMLEDYARTNPYPKIDD